MWVAVQQSVDSAGWGCEKLRRFAAREARSVNYASAVKHTELTASIGYNDEIGVFPFLALRLRDRVSVVIGSWLKLSKLSEQKSAPGPDATVRALAMRPPRVQRGVRMETGIGNYNCTLRGMD